MRKVRKGGRRRKKEWEEREKDREQGERQKKQVLPPELWRVIDIQVAGHECMLVLERHCSTGTSPMWMCGWTCSDGSQSRMCRPLDRVVGSPWWAG